MCVCVCVCVWYVCVCAFGMSGCVRSSWLCTNKQYIYVAAGYVLINNMLYDVPFHKRLSSELQLSSSCCSEAGMSTRTE